MKNDTLNTLPIQQYIQKVKSADSSQSKELRLDIKFAKNLAFTLGVVMSRLEGDLEKIISDSSNKDEVFHVTFDTGGDWS